MVLTLQILVCVLSGLFTLKHWEKPYIIGCIIFNFLTWFVIDSLNIPPATAFGYIYGLLVQAIGATTISFLVMYFINQNTVKKEKEKTKNGL